MSDLDQLLVGFQKLILAWNFISRNIIQAGRILTYSTFTDF